MGLLNSNPPLTIGSVLVLILLPKLIHIKRRKDKTETPINWHIRKGFLLAVFALLIFTATLLTAIPHSGYIHITYQVGEEEDIVAGENDPLNLGVIKVKNRVF